MSRTDNLPSYNNALQTKPSAESSHHQSPSIIGNQTKYLKLDNGSDQTLISVNFLFRTADLQVARQSVNTVEPCLTDSPEMRPSMIMWTLCSVQNAISIDLHTIGTPEMQTPCYSVKHSRHFVDSLAEQKELEAS